MLEQKTLEKEINAYLLEVDAVLKSKGLLKMKGSSELDKVQKEVEATLDQMRAIGRAKGSTNDMRRVSSQSLKRVKWYSDKLRFDRKAPQAAMFGSLSDRGMLGNPAWKSAFTSVAGAVSDFTNAYGRTIANMDQYSRTTIDQTLADLINKAETCYANEPSDLGAQRYLQSSMATIAQQAKHVRSPTEVCPRDAENCSPNQRPTTSDIALQRKTSRKQCKCRTDECD